MIAKNTKQLEIMLMEELKKAMRDASKQALEDMREETSDYYEGSEPIEGGYIRTYKLEKSPKVTPIETDGDTVVFEAYLDQGYRYKTGDKPYMGQVLDLANYGKPWITAGGYPARPTIGKQGFWERAEKKVKKSFERALKDHFK